MTRTEKAEIKKEERQVAGKARKAISKPRLTRAGSRMKLSRLEPRRLKLRKTEHLAAAKTRRAYNSKQLKKRLLFFLSIWIEPRRDQEEGDGAALS